MGWLTDDDLRRFGEQGYLVVPGAVDEELLAAADAEIDELIAADPRPGSQPDGSGPVSWTPTHTEAPRCNDLLRLGPVLEIARELTAPNEVDDQFDTIQIATTIPSYSHAPGAPHIDGHGPDGERIDSFTVLVGIALTDQREPQTGSLWVWPGSHLAHQRLFRERGTRVLQAAFGHECYLDPPLGLGLGVELSMDRGDLLLAHYLLGHNTGGNTGPDTRRTVYCRLMAPGHRDRWESTFLDAWTELPRVRTALGDRARP